MSADFSSTTLDKEGGPSIEARRTKRARWWPLVATVYGLSAFVLAQIVAAIVLVGVAFAKGLHAHSAQVWLESSVSAQFGYILCAELLTIGAIWLALRSRKLSWQSIGLDTPKRRYAGYALAGFAVYFVSYLVIAGLIQAFVPSINLEQKQQIGFESAKTNMQLLFTFASLVLLPPLTEELLFRGFIYSALRQRLRFFYATIITSILFALGHLQFGSGAPLLWIAAIDTFILSIVLCFVREKSTSIWPAILIHAIKNALAFTLLFLIMQ